MAVAVALVIVKNLPNGPADSFTPLPAPPISMPTPTGALLGTVAW